MNSVGGIVKWVVGLLPIAYVAWVLRHFADVGGGDAQGIADIGLGPTVIGLSVVGLLFALPLAIKLIRALSGTNKVPGAKMADPSVETQGFDADAAFANYMRGRDAAPPAPVAPDFAVDEPRPFTPRPGGFGRKVV